VPAAPHPYRDYRKGDPLDFYRLLADGLTAFPPAAADQGVLGLLERIGIGPHRPFDPAAVHPSAVDGLRQAIPDSLQSLYAELPFAGPMHNGWILLNPDTVGDWGVDYYARFEVAQAGLLANSVEEAYYVGAVVDTDDDPLVGDYRYEITFSPGEFPPVEQFWSVTMYENPAAFLVENDAGIYHRGSLTPGLTYAADGSLTLYLQRDAPSPEKRGNWLPTTPPGELFRLILRQYVPRPDILRGRYVPPGVRRVP
jgi:hypothetical protein